MGINKSSTSIHKQINFNDKNIELEAHKVKISNSKSRIEAKNMIKQQTTNYPLAIGACKEGAEGKAASVAKPPSPSTS